MLGWESLWGYIINVGSAHIAKPPRDRTDKHMCELYGIGQSAKLPTRKPGGDISIWRVQCRIVDLIGLEDEKKGASRIEAGQLPIRRPVYDISI